MLKIMQRILLSAEHHGLLDWIPDKIYLELFFRIKIGKRPNLEVPKTFNEKLQWLKLYDRNPEYRKMVDKYEMKKYAAGVIGEEYVIPALGVWEKFEDIDFSSLPEQFVLKCTHDSGGVIICRDKSQFNLEAARRKLNTFMEKNYFYHGREWPYKEIQPRIIAETYLEDMSESGELTDYKLMCFNGKVKCSFTCTRRFSGKGMKVTFYDEKWRKMPFFRKYPQDPDGVPKPALYDEMVRLAEKLSKGIPFVRIDWYEVGKKIYLGEITFFPGSGMEPFEPEVWDRRLGDWLILPKTETGKR